MMTKNQRFIAVISVIISVSTVFFFSSFMFGQEQVSCPINLSQISEAKNRCWALEHGQTTNDTPTWGDLRPYLKAPTPFICPNGGTYTIGRVGEMPICSITNDTEKFRKVYSH